MRNRLLFYGVLAAAAVMAVVGLFLILGGGGETPPRQQAISPPGIDEGPRPTATPAPAPEPTPDNRAVTRIVVPRIGVDAPLITLGISAAGAMEEPKTPTDVGWYKFCTTEFCTAKPGHKGNAIMAGHVDFINYGAAVFYRLRELQAGDEVRLVMDDGGTITYKVVSSVLYDAATAPIQDIVGPTQDETLTLITCGGTFNAGRLEYDKRLVVRGVRS